MYLKRIELEGFKSFADRTVIPVEDGLTGIVGPNGCGKSNVVDALLWVMGERSAKALRADAMEDVIFKGAEGRSSGGFSMVEIILGDDQGEIVEVGGEVAVGRRLFRTGESEFLLHGRKVRRKDVRNLLMDTGLGVRGYMVLAQGKIDAVLAANPAERRSVFEEAAGISRYKARKHETGLKLKSCAQDLDRLEDVIQEVEKSVRSLRYQAGKAQKFLQVRDQYRRLRVEVALSQEARLRVEEETLQSRQAELEKQLQEVRQSRLDSEAALRALEEEEATLRARFEDLRAETSATKEKIAGLDERIRGLEARASEFDQRAERDDHRFQELQQVCAEHQAALQAVETGLQELESEHQELLQAEAKAQARFEGCREQWQGSRAQMDDLRQSILAAMGDRTRAQNELAASAQQRSSAQGTLQAHHRRLQELGSSTEDLHQEWQQAQEALQAAHQAVAQREGRASQLVENRDRLRREVDQCGRRAADARERGGEARARLQALASFEEELQGVPDHLRRLLQEERAEVSGLLLDGVQVAEPWDRLLENLLGKRQQGLWVRSRTVAEDLPEGCFDLFFAEGEALSSPPIEGARAVEDLFRGDPDRCQALRKRLGSLYCVETAEQAARLAQSHSEAVFLSADGELHASGYARIGMLQGEDAAGILARHNARQAAQHALQEASQEEQEAREAHDRAAAELTVLVEELDALEGDLRSAVGVRERAQAQVDDLEKRRRAFAEERAGLEREIQSLEEVCQKAADEEQRAELARDQAENRRNELQSELEQTELRGSEEEQSFEQARGELQEARMAVERLRHRRRNLEIRQGESRKQAKRAGQEQDRLEEEIAQLQARAAALRLEAEASRQASGELMQERVRLEERLQQAGELVQRSSEGLGRLREEVEGSGGRLEALLGNRQEKALELQKVQMQRQELARGVQEEFQRSLEDLADVLEVNWQSARMEDEEHHQKATLLNESRRKLDGFGNVNLDAVEELEEKEQRLDFLVSERKDLLEARGNLEQSLAELDEHCRVRFVETFHKVQNEFEGIFRRLFRGGRAELTLSADMDPLEAGIEISVRPPGKELRSINLLSGGERTLTALALLLAVFRSRPSPFCLLDEVDAALDDANCERFIDALQDFTVGTQFIVVTHNRITMARCQRLYGVTMRRAGVSQLVSVDLSELEAGLANVKADSGAEMFAPRSSDREAPALSDRQIGLEASVEIGGGPES
ncbi:MAG: chromosome segregation protein SMC [Planctomycetota bacterium]|nr:MAG: chromosome segregation protein SMC [Planctomycetota bacterium]